MGSKEKQWEGDRLQVVSSHRAAVRRVGKSLLEMIKDLHYNQHVPKVDQLPPTTHVERLVGDPVDNGFALSDENLAHGSDELFGRAGVVSVITFNLGLDVEEHRVVRCAIDELEHLLQSRDLCSGQNLCSSVPTTPDTKTGGRISTHPAEGTRRDGGNHSQGS